MKQALVGVPPLVLDGHGACEGNGLLAVKDLVEDSYHCSR